MKKRALSYILVFAMLLGLFPAISLSADAADSITVAVDASSSYKPTMIVNGDFSEKPWIDFEYNGKLYTGYPNDVPNNVIPTKKYYNGVDSGWNTTEEKIWQQNFFEHCSATETSNGHNSTLIGVNSLDMNVHDAAVLWQDLTTYGGDIIRWTLDHGVSMIYYTDATQTMRVEVGAPLRNDDDTIIPAEGYGVANTNAKIIENSAAIYKSTGITLGENSRGFGNTAELATLSLTKAANSNGWYTAKGVYIVPDGQNVTRFAFISECPTPACGNELSNITFSTLIGNLSAVYDGKNVIVSGYWGDSENGKKLCVKIGETVHQVDMSTVLNQNFAVTIPASLIGSADSVEVYHSDYVSAKRTITIEHHIHCTCGSTAGSETGHDAEQEWYVWKSANSLPTAAGYYYLANDVTISSTWDPADDTFLCLNGHVIKMTGSGSVINVKSGVDFTLTDCGDTAHNFKVDANGLWTLTDEAKTMEYDAINTYPAANDIIALKGGCITGGKVHFGSTSSGVKVDGGTLTINSGNIVGNYAGAAPGVYVTNNGTCYMAGGRITGNMANNDGGGIKIDVGTFFLSDGDVSYNVGCSVGNGILLVGNESVFTMTGGRITGNHVHTDYHYPEQPTNDYGGGVCLYNGPKMIMTGGSITKNNSKSKGGGLCCFGSFGEIIIGGTACISDNTQSDNITASNVYLPSGSTMTVSTDTPLTTGAVIGVTTETAPTAGSPVPVTGANGADYSAYFTSDNANYKVYNTGSGTVQIVKLSVHEHTWNYSASGATLKAWCSESFGSTHCGNNTEANAAKVNIQAPLHTTYGDGNNPNATLSGTALGALTVSADNIKYYQKVSGTYGTTPIAAPTKAGDYKAEITVSVGTSNYTAYVEYTIAKKELTIAGTSVSDKYYDGTTAAVVSAGALTNALEGDDVGIDTAIGIFKDKNAGNGKTVTVSYTLKGNDAANYLPPANDSLTAAILQKQLTTSETTVSDKVYDGAKTASAAVAAEKLTGVISGDAVTLSCTALFEDKNIGTSKKVSVSYSISGADAANYIAPVDDTLYAAITQKELTVTGTTITEKTYDDTTAATAVMGTVTGVITGDDVTVSVASAAFVTNTAANSKDVTVTYALSGEDAGNYKIAQQTLKGNIKPGSIIVSGTTVDNKTYDGNNTATVHLGTVSGIAEGDDVTVTAVGTFDNKNVGEGKAVTVVYSLIGADAANYTKPADEYKSATISKKTLTVTGTTAVDKVYDGTTAVVLTLGTVTGIETGDNVTVAVLGSFDNKNVGTNKDVPVSYSLSGTDSGNYAAPANETLHAAITQKALTVTDTTIQNKTYDGNTAAAAVVGTVTGIVSGDDVTVSVASAVFDTNTAAANKDVAVTYALSGEDAGNYSIEAQTRKGSIEQKQLTVNGTTAANKIYDAKTAAVVTLGIVEGIVGEDDVTVTAVGTFDNKNVGEGKDVTIDYSISGQQAGNYMLPSEDIQASITSKSITAKWTETVKEYNQTEQAPEYELVGVCTGDEVTITNIGKTDAGSYTLTAELDGTDGANYTLTNPNVNYIIEKAPIAFVVEDDTVPANGGTQTADITAVGENGNEVTPEYTIIYKNGSGDIVEEPTKAGNYDIYAVITDPNYRNADGADGMEQKIGTLTIYAGSNAPKTYQISFIGNQETSGSTAALTDIKSGNTVTLPECGFTKDSYAFAGWQYGSKLYAAGETFTMPATDVELIAQWTQQYTIGGTIFQPDDTQPEDKIPQADAVVKLMSGDREVAQQITDADGQFSFDDVIPGQYNLVVSYDGIIVTTTVEITDQNAAEEDCVLPEGRTNSVVEIAAGSPEIIVYGLEKSFADTNGNYKPEDKQVIEDGGSVEFKLEVAENTSPDADRLAKLRNETANAFLYLNMELNKTTITTASAISTTQLYNSDVLLAIVIPIPADMQGKDSYRVYRFHSDDGTAANEELTKLQQFYPEAGTVPTEEGFVLSKDRTTITVYAKAFSLYAISYVNYSYGNSIQNVTAENGKLTFTPSRANAGQTVTITVTPDEGCQLSSLKVTKPDGTEVELTKVSDTEYRFTMPYTTVSVTPVFEKDEESVCPQDETCVYAKFTDTNTTAWYHDGLHFCIEKGYMNGISETRFAPTGTLSRGMIVTMLWRIEGSPIVNYAMSFDDVEADLWYTEAIRWAQSTGVIKGYDDTSFGPNAAVTREQLAAILMRYAAFKGIDVSARTDLAGFTDADTISAWALENVQWANAAGIITGRTETTVAPTGKATRAEAACMVQRFCETILK